MSRVKKIIEFSQFSVVNTKFKRELWIYKIMTSVFDTHPPLIYVTISSVKEIGFWNRYPPTFYDDVTKYAVFFMASLIEQINHLSMIHSITDFIFVIFPLSCENIIFVISVNHFWRQDGHCCCLFQLGR